MVGVGNRPDCDEEAEYSEEVADAEDVEGRDEESRGVADEDRLDPVDTLSCPSCLLHPDLPPGAVSFSSTAGKGT